MASNVIIPSVLAVTIMLGTLTQLEAVSQQAADKAIAYANDMNAAIDCAYTARPLDACSPNLFSTDFKAETARTQAILADLQRQQAGSHLKKEEDLPKETKGKR